jgi:hypothetical protein
MIHPKLKIDNLKGIVKTETKMMRPNLSGKDLSKRTTGKEEEAENSTTIAKIGIWIAN